MKKNILFLDIDGVLNCKEFYQSSLSDYEEARRKLIEGIKQEHEERLKLYKALLCPKRISWINNLCEETKISVVVSSTWRLNKTVEQLQEILNYAGATFTIIGKTAYTGYERGTEISKWIKDHCMNYFGISNTDFGSYVILDDHNEMLIKQENHFFQTEDYYGLTPEICCKIKEFFIAQENQYSISQSIDNVK